MTNAGLPRETQRLRLRFFEPSDLDAISAYHLLPEAQRYLPIRVRDRQDCGNALRVLRGQVALNRPGDVLSVAINRRGHGREAIGQASLRWADATAGQAEVSIVLARPYRAQGLGSEALSTLMTLGFERFSFHRIFARCDARNEAAARLLKSVGMRLEAHYREHALFQGEWDEELHFAVLDREWARSTRVKDLTRHRVA